jgi:hypothetical protein
MPAYFRAAVREFVDMPVAVIAGDLSTAYASDGYASQYTSQTRAWEQVIPLLQRELREVTALVPDVAGWGVLLEYPLYRLRKRIDAVILTGSAAVVIETKCGETKFLASDLRQVEEYALDLRDFHSESRVCRLVPVLWATEAASPVEYWNLRSDQVASVTKIGKVGLGSLLRHVAAIGGPLLVAERWDRAVYSPVPTVVEAATTIFAGHDVRAIANADASNLAATSRRVVALIDEARTKSQKIVAFVTGVPGAGKTLAGLNAVHSSTTSGLDRGDVVYLSGNTPLVTVLREALARDRHRREPDRALRDIRRDVRTRIQHINDFLKDNVPRDGPPHEHAIVFDEAQRAWDAKQGLKKFGRTASEPELLLEIMSRHQSWAALVCLVGGGQEINTGEQGMSGWGDAVRHCRQSRWIVIATPDAIRGGPSTGGATIGRVGDTPVIEDQALQLEVPLRTFRSPAVSEWVSQVLDGDADAARAITDKLAAYPLLLTRSLTDAKSWLKANARGQRRSGLLASSGARRLRADGLGEILSATDREQIAHWYLNEPGDIRASFAHEVPANEYSSQGLELDFACVCWGGDLVRNGSNTQWLPRRLNGPRWQAVKDAERRSHLMNSYRVLLTRAREGLLIWIPTGDSEDITRAPECLNRTAEFLSACGAGGL